MHTAYIAITVLGALANGYAAVLNFVGAESVRTVADRVRVPQRYMVPFGVLLAGGAIGLLSGLVVPAIGAAAAIGLIAYFIGALSAHLRARDAGFGGAAFFLGLATCALLTNLAYHGK
jgi:DoxX-like family